jgi:NDP-sugar pyrophosphorylase family protein
MHIIIPMSGIGKRFQDAGYDLPKPLISVEGKPIIQHVVELFPRDETTKITFICNDFHLETTKMREILETICPEPNTRIFSVSVKNRRGPVDAVLQIKDYITDDEEVIISYCDYGTQWDFSQFKNLIKEKGVDGVIACYCGFHPHLLGSDNYAFVKVENTTMLEIQEKKPFTDNKMNEYASNGTYYFKRGSMVKKYFQELINKNMATNGEFYVSMVYNLMVQDGLTIKVFEIEKMLQWGTPKDLEEYLVWSNYFLKRKPHFNKIDNIKKTTLILPMAGAGSRVFNQ